MLCNTFFEEGKLGWYFLFNAVLLTVAVLRLSNNPKDLNPVPVKGEEENEMAERPLSSQSFESSAESEVIIITINHSVQYKAFSCCCYCDTRPPSRNRAWRRITEPQKPGNSPEPGPEVVERHRVVKERAAQRIPSLAVQNEMRVVLDRMTTGAA